MWWLLRKLISKNLKQFKILVGTAQLHTTNAELNKAVDLLHIDASRHQSTIRNLTSRIQELEKIVYADETVGIDVSTNRYDKSYMVVVGRYRGREYVNHFTLPRDLHEVGHIIHELKARNKNIKVDAPFNASEFFRIP